MTEPPGGGRRPRLVALDGLRILAALAVAGYHYTVSWRVDGVNDNRLYFPGPVAHAGAYGFLGVEFFFMISGFVIAMSGWGVRVGDFFASRVARLYPAYWTCVLITSAVAIWVPIHDGVPYLSGPPGWGDITANLTMLHQAIGVDSIDGVYWTLFYELRFYVLFALVAWRGMDRRRMILFCVGWMMAAIIAPAARIPLLTLVVMPDYAPYFIAGLALYLIYRYGGSPLLYGIVGFCWMVSMHLATLRLEDTHPGWHVAVWPGLVVVTVAYLALLAVALGMTDRIQWRWLSVLGALTYAFYLLHQRIGYTIIRSTWQATHWPPMAIAGGTIVVLLGAAWLVHRWIEKPFGRVLRAAVSRDTRAVQRPEVPPRRSLRSVVQSVVQRERPRADIPVQAASPASAVPASAVPARATAPASRRPEDRTARVRRRTVTRRRVAVPSGRRDGSSEA